MKQTRSGSSKTVLTTVPLDAIRGPHPRLLDLAKELNLPPAPLLPTAVLNEDLVRAQFELSPPHVIEVKRILRFISGQRLLAMARQIGFQGEIPVILHRGRTDQIGMMTLAMVDDLITPLLYVPGKEMIEIFSRVSRVLHSHKDLAQLIPLLQMDTKHSIAALLGVSVRTLDRHESSITE